MKHAILAVLWIVWCAVHSTLIARTVTDGLKRRLGAGFRYYRLAFNVISLVTLVPIVMYGRSIGGPVVLRWAGPMLALELLLMAAAVWLFVAGSRSYDMLQFLGFRQIAGGESHGALTETGGLNSKGVLGLTRHPWYLASILFLWTYRREFDLPAVVTSGVLTAYLVVGSMLEERKLLVEYGEAYRRYQANVSMLVPFKALRAGGGGLTPNGTDDRR